MKLLVYPAGSIPLDPPEGPEEEEGVAEEEEEVWEEEMRCSE